MALVYNLIYYVIYILDTLIFVRCILSFLPFNNRFTAWVYMATEPILSPCRRLMGRFAYGLPVDFSPILAMLLLSLVQRLVNMIFAIIL